MSNTDSISKHFTVVSLTDPTYSQNIASDFDLGTIDIGTVIRHNTGTRYVKSGSKVFDRIPDSTLSRYDLPFELALSDKRMYLLLTEGSFTARQAYSASQITDAVIISGETPETGSYYCIGCVKFVDASKAYDVTSIGCGCGPETYELDDVVLSTKYLSLFIRYI